MKFAFSSRALAQQKLKQLAEHFSHLSGTFFLYSSDKDSPSYLLVHPIDSIRLEHGELDPWKKLIETINVEENSHSNLPYWAGFLSYEMGAFQEPRLILPHERSSYPLAYFQRSYLTLMQKGQELTLYINKSAPPSHLKDVHDKNFWESLLNQTPVQKEFSMARGSEDDLKSYLRQMKRAKEHILAGDLYQINLSRSLIYKTKGSGFALFDRLVDQNPLSFSAYLNLGDFEVISASPERFLSKKAGTLLTQPIKGTIKRDPDPTKDIIQKDALLKSTKDEAELMMICDLMRNDLGQISEIGSVHCLKKKHLLELKNVYHLESHVISKALDIHPLKIVQACFPAGSITGCPKISSMKLIHRIEKRARHLYCGSIGYLTAQGDFDFSVAIRTATLKDNQLELQVGGAITYDSDLVAEYEETQAKGSPFEEASTKIGTST